MSEHSQERHLLINFNLGPIQNIFKYECRRVRRVLLVFLGLTYGGLHMKTEGTWWQEDSLEAILFVLSRLTTTSAAKALS